MVKSPGGGVAPKEKPQVVERVAKILGAISSHGAAGARLKDIAIDVGIARPTVHRLLGELGAVDFVLQRPDKRYTLGPALFSLGLSAPSPIRDIARIRQLAQGLADHCGDVVYVALRKFDGVHYLVRAEGSYPIRTHLVSENQSKPFTASYSGLALLASLGEEECRSAINKLALDAPSDWVEKNRRGRHPGLLRGQEHRHAGNRRHGRADSVRHAGALHDRVHLRRRRPAPCRARVGAGSAAVEERARHVAVHRLNREPVPAPPFFIGAARKGALGVGRSFTPPPQETPCRTPPQTPAPPLALLPS